MAAPQRLLRGGAADGGRKQRGDFPTPHHLVQLVVDGVMPLVQPGQSVSVLDPACGDGRFLAVAADRIAASGGHALLHGVDLDPVRAAEARAALDELATGCDRITARVDDADALRLDWSGSHYDVVLGNPPYLSQLAAATSRRGASPRGGGPYADTAAEFLHLAVGLARPGGGRVGMVLPQSILAARDAGAIRRAVDGAADLVFSWWSPDKHFDAEVVVCALGFERRAVGNSEVARGDPEPVWTDVILSTLGVPRVPAVNSAGTVGDRARLTADFRDQYYGLVPGVGDHDVGPRFVTSGSIDPLRCRWGERPVRFHRSVFTAPRVDVGRLDDAMQAWAAEMAVPKVLVANQSAVLECVVDRDGTYLPGVPVITVRPPPSSSATAVYEIAAVLTSPLAAAWVWQHAAGTGLSAHSVRVAPRLLAEVPWPAGPLGDAAAAARVGDAPTCGRAVMQAYGIVGARAAPLYDWWAACLPAR